MGSNYMQSQMLSYDSPKWQVLSAGFNRSPIVLMKAQTHPHFLCPFMDNESLCTHSHFLCPCTSCMDTSYMVTELHIELCQIGVGRNVKGKFRHLLQYKNAEFNRVAACYYKIRSTFCNYSKRRWRWRWKKFPMPVQILAVRYHLHILAVLLTRLQ